MLEISVVFVVVVFVLLVSVGFATQSQQGMVLNFANRTVQGLQHNLESGPNWEMDSWDAYDGTNSNSTIAAASENRSDTGERPHECNGSKLNDEGRVFDFPIDPG